MDGFGFRGWVSKIAAFLVNKSCQFVQIGVGRPNLTSVVAAMLVLLFADNWNISDQAVVFLKETFDFPLSVYLGQAVQGDPGMFFAVSVFYLIPSLLVFLLGQDYLTEGIALSSVKA